VTPGAWLLLALIALAPAPARAAGQGTAPTEVTQAPIPVAEVTLRAEEVGAFNSMLVADKVTNWTPVEQRRRLDIPVNVAYGTAPDKVLKVLTEVAHGHPDVAAELMPQPLFLGFGDSALRCVPQVWTDRVERHGPIKSEPGMAVYAALREAGMTIPFPRQEIRVHHEPPPR